MNLILITIDCLRADHLSCLGYSKKITPNLDYLASVGVTFSQAISVGSWTVPSFISIFTSSYPLMWGGQLYVADSRTTVAQVVKEHGYRTAAFHSNPFMSRYNGYHKGFDVFDDSVRKSRYEVLLKGPKELIKKIIRPGSGMYEFLSQIYTVFITGYPFAKGEELNEKATSWLHDNASNFFLWLHYMDAHEPYLPPQKTILPFKRQHICKLCKKGGDDPRSLSPEGLNELIDLYDSKVRYVDGMIGSLLDVLRKRGILDNTFVMVTADHGQQFMEHGSLGHCLYLYDELINVPLIIIGPGLKPCAINEQASLLDIAPTILDLLGMHKPANFQGDSLVPQMTGRSKARALEAISEEGISKRTDFNLARMRGRLDIKKSKISLRTGKWKYIYVEGGQDELYNLKDDPKERQSVIHANPKIAAELRTKIMAHIEFEERSIPGEEELIKTRVSRLKGRGKI